jgi:hypothetical protein
MKLHQLEYFDTIDEMVSFLSDLIANYDVSKLDYNKVAEASGAKYSEKDKAIVLPITQLYLTPENIEKLEEEYPNIDFSQYLESLFKIQDKVLYTIAEEISRRGRVPIYYLGDSFGLYISDIDFKFEFDCESERVAKLIVRDFFIDLQDEPMQKLVQEKLDKGYSATRVVNDYFKENEELFIYNYLDIAALTHFVGNWFDVKDTILESIEKEVKSFLNELGGLNGLRNYN